MHFLPAVPGVADTIAPTVEVAVNEVVLGKATPEESLKKWQSNATELLEAEPGEVRKLTR